MQSPPFPRYLIPPRSKYSPQHHVLKHTQLPFLPQYQRPSFTPIKTTDKFIFLHILIFKFLDSNLEDIRFCTEWQQAFPDLSQLLISSAIKFWFVKFVPKYLNTSALSKVLLSILTRKNNNKCNITFGIVLLTKLLLALTQRLNYFFVNHSV